MALKKQWYEIVAPKAFGEKVVGETPSVDPRSLVGRKINVSLMDVAREYQKFYVKLQFQIERVEGIRAYTKFVGHDIMRERIYRMVQRRVRRVDVIQDLTTKDGIRLRVKTVFVLIRRVNTSTKAATRQIAKEFIEKAAKEANFEDFVKSMVTGQLQQAARKEINKISPVGNIEVRKSELLREKKKVAAV